MNTKGFVIVLL